MTTGVHHFNILICWVMKCNAVELDNHVHGMKESDYDPHLMHIEFLNVSFAPLQLSCKNSG